MTGLHQTALHLASRNSASIQTSHSGHRNFRLFLAYCCFFQIQLHQLTPVILLSLLEFLIENGISNSAIANYISAVKASLYMYCISTLPFYDQRIKYFQKCLALNKPFTATIKKFNDIPLPKDIIAICDTMWMGQGPRWHSGNSLPLVGSLQYRSLTNSMYWFPLPFQLPVVI